MLSGDQQDLFDSSEHITPLTSAQLRAAELFAMGRKRDSIAAELGVRVRDLAAWQRLPGFAEEVGRIHSEARGECVQSLRKLGDSAVLVIKDILSDPDTSPGVRASTAFRVLEMIGVGPECFATPEPQKQVKKAIDSATLDRISSEIYGLED